MLVVVPMIISYHFVSLDRCHPSVTGGPTFSSPVSYHNGLAPLSTSVPSPRWDVFGTDLRLLMVVTIRCRVVFVCLPIYETEEKGRQRSVAEGNRLGGTFDLPFPQTLSKNTSCRRSPDLFLPLI